MSVQERMLREQLHNLYFENHHWLYVWLCRKMGCVHQAEDVAQNTFLRLLLFQGLDHIKEPRAFLTITASRLIIDEARRKKVQQRYLDTHSHYAAEAVAPSREELALIAEKLATIIQLLENLPEKCQRAFLMSKFDGMRYADIATKLGVSKSMVQQYMTKVTVAYYKLTYELDLALQTKLSLNRTPCRHNVLRRQHNGML
jgi:RNA polymerase sigma factor (sigma-70 family)